MIKTFNCLQLFKRKDNSIDHFLHFFVSFHKECLQWYYDHPKKNNYNKVYEFYEGQVMAPKMEQNPVYDYTD